MARKYKKANGQGSVYKLSGNRRNPWVASITGGWDAVNGKAKQKRKIIGYYPSQTKAESALDEYLSDPYDLESKGLTFSEVYEKWSDEYYEKLTNPSSARTYKAAYNHSGPLHNLKMKEIRVAHLEAAIKSATAGDATKARMKSMYNMMYKYALKHGIVKTDYAALCESIKVGVNAPKVPFTDEEILKLWSNRDIPYVDMALIEIYSGWRPQELVLLRTTDVDLHNMTMFGGMKTDAGKDRIVPIHSAIADIIKKYYYPGKEYLFSCLSDGSKLTYDKYYKRFTDTMKHLEMDHKPHETRHTFITLAKRYEMNEYVLKRIVGHKIQDITEDVYTHRDVENLRIEIEKIKAPSL